jgi:hypothetical protein
MARIQPVETHSAFMCFRIRVLIFKNWGTIWTYIIAQSTSYTFFAINQNRPEFFFLENSVDGTTIDTGRLFTMVAGDPSEMYPNVRETAFLVFIDPEIFNGSKRQIIPILTSNRAGPATRASTLVKEKPVL